MKKIITITLILLSITAITKAQCKTELKEKVGKNATGIFLGDKEITADTVETEMVLRKDFEYGFYLFSKNLKTPEFKIFNSENKQVENFKEIYNAEEGYRYIKYKAQESGKFTVKFDLDKNKKNCFLFAFYLQTDLNKLKKQKQ